MENDTLTEQFNRWISICPKCGCTMIPSGGCFYCPNCGESPCS